MFARALTAFVLALPVLAAAIALPQEPDGGCHATLVCCQTYDANNHEARMFSPKIYVTSLITWFFQTTARTQNLVGVAIPIKLDSAAPAT